MNIVYDPCTGLEYCQTGRSNFLLWRESGTDKPWRRCDAAFWLALSELWQIASEHVRSGGDLRNMPFAPLPFTACTMRAVIETLLKDRL
ncbi:MAG: hypothetical protein KatS3mg038_1011 [Candidatus Kapaibacterium sp.]|nr:MAG: hypothetical protein KatS3mg038_1011 [Candidatus Kapabacteria bacterium]